MDNDKKFSLDDILDEFSVLGTNYVSPDVSDIKIEMTANLDAVKPVLPGNHEKSSAEVSEKSSAEVSAEVSAKVSAKVPEKTESAQAETAVLQETVQQEISPAAFREKYEELEYKTADELLVTEAKRLAVTPRRVDSAKKAQIPRGFSKKQEIIGDYTEERAKSKSDRRGSERSFSDKLEDANLYFKSDRFIIEGDSTRSKAFTPDKAEDHRIVHSHNRAVDDILNEFPEKKPSFLNTISSTYHKAITGFFTRILPKTSEIPTDINNDNPGAQIFNEAVEEAEKGSLGNHAKGTDNAESLHTADAKDNSSHATDNNPPRATDSEGNLYPDENDSAGLVSKADLYSDAGRRHTPKKYRSEPQYRKNISELNLGNKLGSKLIPHTGTIEDSEEAKLRELAERRLDKVKSFRLVGSEEDEEKVSESSSGDFDSYDSTRRISLMLRKNIKNYILSALVLFICAVLGLFIAGINDILGLDTPNFINKIQNTNVFLVINSIIGVVAGGAAFSTVNNGITKLLDGKPDSDTMVSLLLAGSILLSCVMFADTNMVKFGYVQIMVPVAVTALFFNICGKTMLSSKALKNFKIFSGAKNKYAVFTVDDYDKVASLTRGMFTVTPVLAAYAETEFATDFLKKTYAPDVSDRFAKTSMPAVMIAGALLGIITGFMNYSDIGWACIYAGISVFFTVCAVASGFINVFIVGSPSASEASRLNSVGSVMPGYDGAEEFADASALTLDARALYPHGSIGLLGVKLFTDTRLDEAIVEAASLTHQAGSILDTMFYDIIRGKTELLNPVESFIYEDSLGLCGWINNRRVLLGNRLLMINHSINGLPTEAKEAEYTGRKKSAVYLSIAGELSAMFIVDLIPNLEIADALLELQRKNISVILRTVDSVLTIAKISDMFDISPEYIKLLPFRYSEQFDEVTEYRPRISANAVSTGNITGIAAIFTSAKKIRAAALSGLTLQMAAMVIGVLIMLAMIIFGEGREMSVLFISAYNLAFLVILILIHSIGKLFP
ncbi:MAG: hypothetical protein LBL80_01010 [Ruminococcus sp.]|jgi:Cu+-exporting ATPase|nr:hypothetical protein [Ruminococcus sp.]